MQYRKATKADAAGIIAVMENAEQAGTMLWSPGEREMEEATFAQSIEQEDTARSGFFVAEDEEGIAGYIFIKGEQLERIRHRAHLVMGMHERVRGQGIGTEFLEYVIDWAKHSPLRRLELTVLTINEQAIRLYEKCGFEKEGVKRDSLRINELYVDELTMSYLL